MSKVPDEPKKFGVHVFAGALLFVDGHAVGECGPITVTRGEVPRSIREMFPTAIGAVLEPGVLRVVYTNGADTLDDTYSEVIRDGNLVLQLEKRTQWVGSSATS